MELATKMLNLLSAVIIMITWFYVLIVFDPVLSEAIKALLWLIVLIYSGLQFEKTFNLFLKHLEDLSG
ncbi:MAG: hypothetical protein ACE5D6_03820 [Candidatus Zixiibacteriota bacterium]